MAEHSAYQQKIIQRYYDHRDEILLARLQELVGALYLADSDRKMEQGWNRVDTAMVGLKVPDALRERLLAGRDVESLARHVRQWLDEAKRSSKPR